MDKKFTFGLIALLGVSLFILGCDDSSDDSTQAAEQAAAELVKDLGDEFAVATGGGNVELRKNMTDDVAVEVKAGVTLDTKGFTLAATTLKVDGTVKLDKAAAPTGAVTVGKSGRIIVDKADGILTIGTSLTLAEGGVLETKGGGTVVIEQTTFGGVGTWTASATGGDEDPGVSGISITVATDVTTVALAAGNKTSPRTAGILTASGTDPTITQAAGQANNDLIVSAATTINLGGTSSASVLGKILLGQGGTGPGKLSLTAADSVILTLAAGTSGTAYGTSLTSIDSDMVITGTDETKVFQVGGKLTRLTGATGVLTGKASGSSTNKIASDTDTAGS
jgi:filamentous hemagglutinin